MISRTGILCLQWLRKTQSVMTKTCIRNFSSEPAVMQGQKIQINKSILHFEKVGNGDHVVLLLPGALGTTRNDFGPQLEKLNRSKFTVVAWDPPGCGFSRPPDREFTTDFLHKDADLAANLMKTLKFNKYSIVGWSDGGITSLIMAANHANSVRKIVVLAGQAYVTQQDAELMAAIQNIDKWSQRMRDPMIAVYGEEYFRQMWHEEVECFNKIVCQNGGDICKDLLPLIKCPTLIVQGEKDPLVPREHADYLHKSIPNSKLHLFAEGKHNLHLRYADEFNKLIEDFLCD